MKNQRTEKTSKNKNIATVAAYPIVMGSKKHFSVHVWTDLTTEEAQQDVQKYTHKFAAICKSEKPVFVFIARPHGCMATVYIPLEA